MSRLFTIDYNKAGKILIRTNQIESFITEQFVYISGDEYHLNSVNVGFNEYDDELEIHIMVKLKRNTELDLEQIRSMQNHLCAFLSANLGIYTKRISLGVSI